MKISAVIDYVSTKYRYYLQLNKHNFTIMFPTYLHIVFDKKNRAYGIRRRKRERGHGHH